MNCRRCNWPYAPHELVDHEGEGKGATGLCLKCLKAERDGLVAACFPTQRHLTDEERQTADEFFNEQMNEERNQDGKV